MWYSFSIHHKESEMANRVYRTPIAALRAAQQRLGGRIVTIDGALALSITMTGLSGQIVEDFLTPKKAAKKAGVEYQPPRPGD